MSHQPTRRPVQTRARPTGILVCAMAALLPTLARADVEWHADLETAHAAARISHRPVLAVFVASWGSGARSLETTSLGSPEAEAVLATCFEPVRIDIDEHAELTRRAGVTHVPTACVLAADGVTLESFEMPATPAQFVKTAILAAQRAAAVEHGVTSHATDRPATTGPRLPPEPSAITAAAFGSTSDVAADTTRPPRGSLSRVAAKVRELSAFATDETPMAAAPMSTAPVAAAPVALARASRAVEEDPKTYEPNSWPAEPASAPPTAVAAAPAIEPAATAMTPSTVAPWLDAPAVRPAPAAPVPQPAAAPPQPAAPPATAAPLPAPAPAAPAQPPAPGGLWATLQKPFALFGRQAADPPTMPPALPRSEHAATAPTTPAPAASPDTVRTAAPDPVGSMPLGLEGYCPVTLVDRGTWTEGRAQWGARHRGRTYLFAGIEEQRTFLSNPDRYAPALSGDDPVLALDRGSSTPGQRRYGITYQARIYLFASPETRQAFANDPARYVARVALAERPPATPGGGRLY